MYQAHVDAIKHKSVLKNIVIPIFVVLLTIVFSAVGLFIPPIAGSVDGINLGFVIAMCLTIMFAILMARLASKIKVTQLGFVKEKIFLSYVLGAAFGFILVTIVFLVVLFTNTVIITCVVEPTFIPTILIALLFFMVQGLYEEVLVRGYLMLNFSKIMGNNWAIYVSSLVFSLLHALNPNVELLPLINIFIFGVIFGYLYVLTGNIWVVGAFHSFWNFGLGIIYGSNVSGMTLGDSVLRTIPIGNELISGGEFGFEGSIVTTFVGILCILLLLKYNLKGNQNKVEQ